MIYGDEPQQIGEYEDPLGASRYTYAPQITAVMQAGNLYGYGVNNPIYYMDITGNSISVVLMCIIVGAVVGAVANAGINVYRQIKNGTSFEKINWASVGVSFVAGALSGGIAGSPIGLLGQVAFNAIISGAESALQDKVYGRDIDWGKVAVDAGIGALVGLAGGKGATVPVKKVYGKMVGVAGRNLSVVFLTYSSKATAEAAAKALAKSLAKGYATQILVTDNVVKIIYEE